VMGGRWSGFAIPTLPPDQRRKCFFAWRDLQSRPLARRGRPSAHLAGLPVATRRKGSGLQIPPSGPAEEVFVAWLDLQSRPRPHRGRHSAHLAGLAVATRRKGSGLQIPPSGPAEEVFVAWRDLQSRPCARRGRPSPHLAGLAVATRRKGSGLQIPTSGSAEEVFCCLAGFAIPRLRSSWPSFPAFGRAGRGNAAQRVGIANPDQRISGGSVLLLGGICNPALAVAAIPRIWPGWPWQRGAKGRDCKSRPAATSYH